MKRLCVFAHWDKDNLIDDYVLYYLKALKEVCSIIIFVSDTDISPDEQEKLNGISNYNIIGRHNEYDFGSYKRGFLFAKENNIEFDELLFVNDSCYGPFYPLKPIFEKMEKKKCDFWGLTQNSYGLKKEGNINVAAWQPHIQSYFLVFKSNIINSNIFQEYIKNVNKEDDKDNIITKYEIGLSEKLWKNGFKSAIYINNFIHTENCLASKWKKLIEKYKFPFVKTSIIRKGLFVTGEILNWQEIIKNVSDYPIQYIEENKARYNLQPEENLYKSFNLYRKVRYNILNNSPMELRKIVINVEKYGYKILNNLLFNKLKKF